jgi:hypothetical protein
MKLFHKKLIFLSLFSTLSFLTSIGQIGGTVFRDYNANGTRETYEIGVGGINVSIFNSFNIQVGATVTNAAGAYNFPLSTGTAVRVEFSIPNAIGCFSETGVYSGPQGSGSGSAVQFATSPNTNINFGLNNPNDYSQPNPIVATPCYVAGDPTLAANPGVNGGVQGLDVLVGLNYNDGSVTANTAMPSHLAKAEQIGAVWGLAYQKETKKLFSSAVIKRHCALGPLGTSGIYVTDFNGTPATSNFIQLSTLGVNFGVDHHVPNGSFGGYDMIGCDRGVFDDVGKVGIGDIDLSEDGKNMFITNLFDRTIYVLKINNPATTPAAGSLTAIASCPWLTETCNKGVSRPWGLKIHRNNLYVGVVCTGENAGQNIVGGATDLYAKVYQYNIATSTWNTTPIVTIPLNYTKGSAATWINTSYVKMWNPWVNVYPTYAFNWADPAQNFIIYPEPILSDIEFDTDGSMILGLMDRFGNQSGSGTLMIAPDGGSCWYTLTAGYNAYTYAASSGDILRVTHSNNTACTAFTTENNGSASGNTTAGANNGQGPGNGEYYYEDNFNGHDENTVGGLALKQGSNEVIATMYDAFRVGTGGITWFNNTTGGGQKRYEVFISTSSSLFGKSNGLGDIEILADPAPIEIGNLVWLDANRNGIQDAGEAGISNVTVLLFKGGVQVGSTITDGNGNYKFTGLTPNTAYTIKIDNTQANLSGKLPSAINQSSNTGIDSDGSTLAVNTIGVNLTTGNYGQNNHTYDFAFAPPAPCAITITLNIQKPCNDNSTPANTADDYYLMTVNATAISGGATNKYEVVYNSTVLNPGGTTYGSLTLIGAGNIFRADGNSTYNITIRDINNSSCSASFTTAVVTPCSVCPNIDCIPITATRH